MIFFKEIEKTFLKKSSVETDQTHIFIIARGVKIELQQITHKNKTQVNTG